MNNQINTFQQAFHAAGYYTERLHDREENFSTLTVYLDGSLESETVRLIEYRFADYEGRRLEKVRTFSRPAVHDFENEMQLA